MFTNLPSFEVQSSGWPKTGSETQLLTTVCLWTKVCDNVNFDLTKRLVHIRDSRILCYLVFFSWFSVVDQHCFPSQVRNNFWVAIWCKYHASDWHAREILTFLEKIPLHLIDRSLIFSFDCPWKSILLFRFKQVQTAFKSAVI